MSSHSSRRRRRDVMDAIEQVRAAVSEKRAVVGSRQVARALRAGSLALVLLAASAPAAAAADITRAAALSGTPLERFAGTGRQLGVLCGKPFSIAVIGVKHGNAPV